MYKEKNNRVYIGAFVESLSMSDFVQCQAHQGHRTHVSWHGNDGISDKFPRDADAAGPGPILGELLT